MATKPITKPTWATDPNTTAEPEAAVKATGWTAIKPPFQWMNWLQNLFCKWIDWFDQQEMAHDSMLGAVETRLTAEETHVHDGTDSAKINPVAHVLGVSEGEFDITFETFASPLTVTARYRVEESPTAGKAKIVTLTLPDTTGTSNNQNFDTGPATPVPETLRPAWPYIAVPIVVYNLGNEYMGAFKVYADGRVSVLIGHNDPEKVNQSIDLIGAFTNSGSKGFPAFLIKYPVYPST